RRDLLARVSVDAVARHSTEAFDPGLAIDPVEEERAHHMVAHGEFAHALPDCGNLPGPVRHRDAFLLRPHEPLHHAIVVVVERTGPQAHGDFPGARFHRCRGADPDVREPASGGDVYGFDGHARSLDPARHDGVPADGTLCREVPNANTAPPCHRWRRLL